MFLSHTVIGYDGMAFFYLQLFDFADSDFSESTDENGLAKVYFPFTGGEPLLRNDLSLSKNEYVELMEFIQETRCSAGVNWETVCICIKI